MRAFLFIHDDNPWEFPPFEHPLVRFTSLRPYPFRGTGRVVSGGVLSPEPPRAAGVWPEPLPISNPLFPHVFLILPEIGCFPHVFWARSEIGHS